MSHRTKTDRLFLRRPAGLALVAALAFTATVLGRAPAQTEAPRPRPKPESVQPPRPKPPAERRSGERAGRPAVIQVEDTTNAEEETRCRAQLAASAIDFDRAAAITGPGNCGIRVPLIVRSLAPQIPLTPAATLNCRMARALQAWLDEAVQPAAERYLGAAASTITVAASYVCRSRNLRPGAKLSEHGFGNAIDISGIAFEDGTTVSVGRLDGSDGQLGRLQGALRNGACARFTTVLGPGSDDAHGGHFHFDLRQRPGGYRLCQ